MGLLKRLRVPMLAGSLFLPLISPAYTDDQKEEFNIDELMKALTDEQLVVFANKIWKTITPDYSEPWVDDKGKVIGRHVSWDINGDGLYDLLARVNFVKGTVRNLGDISIGIPERTLSEIFWNGGNKYLLNTLIDEDKIFERNPEGNYERAEYFGEGLPI